MKETMRIADCGLRNKRHIDWRHCRTVTKGYAIIIGFLLLIVWLGSLYGCRPTLLPAIPEGSGFQIPVMPAKPAPPPAQYANVDEVIVVPPSDTITTIQVSRKPRTLRQVIREQFTNTATHEVKSDNKDVQAYQPKKTVWWKWVAAVLLGLLFACALIMGIARRAANFSPMGFLKKMLGGKKE